MPFELGGATALDKKLLPFLTHQSLDIPLYLHDIRTAQSIEEVVHFLSYLKNEANHEKRIHPQQPTKVQLSQEARTHDFGTALGFEVAESLEDES